MPTKGVLRPTKNLQREYQLLTKLACSRKEEFPNFPKTLAAAWSLQPRPRQDQTRPVRGLGSKSSLSLHSFSALLRLRRERACCGHETTQHANSSEPISCVSGHDGFAVERLTLKKPRYTVRCHPTQKLCNSPSPFGNLKPSSKAKFSKKTPQIH